MQLEGWSVKVAFLLYLPGGTAYTLACASGFVRPSHKLKRMIVECLTITIGEVSCGLDAGQSEVGLTLQPAGQIYTKHAPEFRRSDRVEAQTPLGVG